MNGAILLLIVFVAHPTLRIDAFAGFCVKLGIPQRLAESFMLLSVSAFLMTSVDAGTRLARFSWQELVGRPEAGSSIVKKGAHNMFVGTFIVCAMMAALLLGNPVVAKQLWTLFGGANQLLASLTLLTATLWLVRNKKPGWVTALPMVLMFSVSTWALTKIFMAAIRNGEAIRFVSAGFLLSLAVALLVVTVVKGRKAVK